MKTSHKIIIVLAIAVTGITFYTRSTPEEKEAKYLKQGNSLFVRGEYEKARLDYRNAARFAPVDAEIDYRMGLVDEAEGDINNAFAAFNRAELQNAHYDPALLKLAGYYLIAERYDEAQKRVDMLLSDSPGDLQAHALEAALLLHQKDLPGAEKEARFVLGKDPANVTAISVLTGLYLAQGNEAMAGKTIEEGIARNPKDMSLLTLKAKLYARSNNIAKINEAYQAMFRLKPDDAQLRIALADIFIEAKQLDNAEATLRAGVAAMPENWQIKRDLVLFLSEHRGLDAAEKEVKGYMQAYPKKDELYFWLVELYTQHNAIDKAVTLLNQIIAQNPVGEPALNARTDLARIHFNKGDKQLADKMVKAVLQKDPDNKAALLIQANMEFDQGLYSDAVSDLRNIIHDQPKNKDALQLLSEVLLRQGHIDLAIDTLSQLMDIDPLNSAVRVRLAQMYNLNGDSGHALELLSMVNRNDPAYAIGWESTARIALGTKDLSKAQSAINTLSAFGDQQMTSAFLEGQVQASTGKNQEAIASFSKVINANPSAPLAEHAVSALVGVYQRMNRLDEAAKYIENIKTDNPYMSTILGECYIKLGKTDRGAAAFDKAIAEKASFQEPYLERARLYLEDHQPEQAIAVLKKGIDAAPADVRAPMMEAYVLEGLGRYQEAIEIYNGILRKDPGFSLAANNLAAVISDYEYNDPAMLEKARKIAEQFIGSSNPLLLDTLGWIYYRQGNLNQALILTKQAKASGAKVPPEVHYHYGAIFLKSGDKAEAKEELQQAVIAGGDYHGMEDAREMLQGL